MEAFAVNFLYRTTSSNLQCRFLLVPWVTKGRGICCSSEGTDNPSFPVRYVPKTSKKTEKPPTIPKPIKGSDKKVIKKSLDSHSMRLDVFKKSTVSQNSSALEIKPQTLYQGVVNGLLNGSYQEANEGIYRGSETMEDELEEDAEELEIQEGKFPLCHDLRAGEDKENAENSSFRLFATSSSNKTSGSSIPVKHENQTRLTPVKGSDVKVIKKFVYPNVARFEVANGSMVSQNSFSDKKLQYRNQGPASNITHFRQETDDEMKYDEETMDDEFMEEPEENTKELGIHSGNHLLSQNLQACENKEEAEKAAIRLLATRAYTAVELRKKLHGKRFLTSTIDALIREFQSRGLINDGLYAESFARSRWSSSSWGPRRVKQALLKKGVTEVDTEEALKLVYEDDDEYSSLGLSKVSMDQLYTQASKQWLRGQDSSHETRKSRIIRWLQYRGFSWGVTSFILKKLESKHPS